MNFTEQVGALRRTLRRAIIRRVALGSDRPLPQLQALRLVAKEEVQTQAELAERLLIDAPAASRLVMRLEEDGLLKRMPGSDRRCVCLKVTPAAKAEIAVMDANGAANIIFRREIDSADDPVARKAELVEEYRERFANPYNAGERGYVDDVIDPRDTRRMLARALSMLRTKREQMPARKHGNSPL